MLFFSPEKLRDCVSLINKIHEISLKSGENGRFGAMMAYLTPPGAANLCPGFRVFYNGSEERAKELAAPIYNLEPAIALGGMCRFPETTETPGYMDFTGFNRYAASSAHIDYPLDETLVYEVFQKFRKVVETYPDRLKPSKCMLDLRNYQKVASIPIDAMAYSGRFDTAWMLPDLQWDDPSLDATMRREVTSITGYIREQMQARNVQAPGDRDVTAIYPNISAGGEEKAKSVFGPNLPRLQQLKRKYDPDFIWNKWFPIMPA